MVSQPRKRRDLAEIAGSWKTDKAMESAPADLDSFHGTKQTGHSAASQPPTATRVDGPSSARATSLPAIVIPWKT